MLFIEVKSAILKTFLPSLTVSNQAITSVPSLNLIKKRNIKIIFAYFPQVICCICEKEKKEIYFVNLCFVRLSFLQNCLNN